MQLSVPTLPFDSALALPGGQALTPVAGQLPPPSAPGDFSRLLGSATEAAPAGVRPMAASTSPVTVAGSISNPTAGGIVLSAANFQVAQPTLARALDGSAQFSPASRWLTPTMAAKEGASPEALPEDLAGPTDTDATDQDADLPLGADGFGLPVGSSGLETTLLSAVVPLPASVVSTVTMQSASPAEGSTTTSPLTDAPADGMAGGRSPTSPGLIEDPTPRGANGPGLAKTMRAGLAGAAVGASAPLAARSGMVKQISGSVEIAIPGATLTATPLASRDNSGKKIADDRKGEIAESKSAASFPAASGVRDSLSSMPADLPPSANTGLISAPDARTESQPTDRVVADPSGRAASTLAAKADVTSVMGEGTPTLSPKGAESAEVVTGFEPLVSHESPASLPISAKIDSENASLLESARSSASAARSPEMAAVNTAPSATDPLVAGTMAVGTRSQNIPPENFAGSPGRSTEKSVVVDKTTQRKSLLIERELDGERLIPVGINAAKSVIPMPNSAPSSPSVAPVNEAPSFSVAPLSFEGLMKDSAGAPPELDHLAHRAVESAMAAVEHFANSEQKSVNLQFTVSGVDLAVRVELRGENVHTTFRTDSPELRSALANEWQMVTNAPSNEGAQRFADPVFTTPTGTAAAGADFGPASQQRQSGSRQNPSLPPEFSGFRGTGLSVDPTTESAGAQSPLILPASTSRRLNTFA